MPRRRFLLALSLALSTALTFAPGLLAAQERRDNVLRVAEQGELQRIRLVDETTIVGRITSITPDSVRIEGDLGAIDVHRNRIAEVRTYSSRLVREGVLYVPDPNATRLFFAPTGRVLASGDGYIANHMLFVMSGAGAISSRVTFGGGMTIFPLDDFSDNMFFVTPKVGLVRSEQMNVAVGGLFGHVAGSDGGSLGVAYAVMTYGAADASLSAGAAWGMIEGQWSSSPAVMVGGNLRLSRRLSAISENYVFPGERPIVMYGLRMFGERFSADFAFVNSLEDAVFPGIPFVGLAYHF